MRTRSVHNNPSSSSWPFFSLLIRPFGQVPLGGKPVRRCKSSAVASGVREFAPAILPAVARFQQRVEKFFQRSAILFTYFEVNSFFNVPFSLLYYKRSIAYCQMGVIYHLKCYRGHTVHSNDNVTGGKGGHGGENDNTRAIPIPAPDEKEVC